MFKHFGGHFVSCILCFKVLYFFQEAEIRKIQQDAKIRDVSDNQRQLVKDLLVGYRESMPPALYVPPSIATGLTDEKIDKIVTNLEKINSTIFLVQRIGVVDIKTVYKILKIINMVFDDMVINFDAPVENMVFDTEYFSDNDSIVSKLLTDSSEDE